MLRVIVLSLLASSITRVDVGGDYRSDWGAVHLVQQGTVVRGSYPEGTIQGRIVDERLIRFDWDEPRARKHGKGVWQIKGDTLEGWWGWDGSEVDGGLWSLWRKR